MALYTMTGTLEMGPVCPKLMTLLCLTHTPNWATSNVWTALTVDCIKKKNKICQAVSEQGVLPGDFILAFQLCISMIT